MTAIMFNARNAVASSLAGIGDSIQVLDQFGHRALVASGDASSGPRGFSPIAPPRGRAPARLP